MKCPELDRLSKDELIGIIEDEAKNWLAHDGLWFQAVEKHYGIEDAIELDKEAWGYFTVIEARRIIKRIGLPKESGLDGLKKALTFRMYGRINEQTISRKNGSLILKMTNCRVQAARERKQMDYFPCKPVGIIEYSKFAETIDGRIKTECIACPPDESERNFHCGWKFSI